MPKVVDLSYTESHSMIDFSSMELDRLLIMISVTQILWLHYPSARAPSESIYPTMLVQQIPIFSF